MGTTSPSLTPTSTINLTTTPPTRTYYTATFNDGTNHLSPVTALEPTPLGHSGHPTTFSTMTHSLLASPAAPQQDLTSQTATASESVVWYNTSAIQTATWALGFYAALSLFLVLYMLSVGGLDFKLNFYLHPEREASRRRSREADAREWQRVVALNGWDGDPGWEDRMQRAGLF